MQASPGNSQHSSQLLTRAAALLGDSAIRVMVANVRKRSKSLGIGGYQL